MAFTDDRPSRWGCVVGPALISPLAFFWLLVGAMGGGGCEGDLGSSRVLSARGCEGDPDPNCVGDYTPTWIGVAVLAVVALGIALGINRFLKWRFDRRH